MDIPIYTMESIAVVKEGTDAADRNGIYKSALGRARKCRAF